MKSSLFSWVQRMLLLPVLLWIATGCAAQRPNHVFVISFDGGKPAVMRESKMPVLNQVVQEGAYSWEAQTILPSITLVSHTSMLTGVSPAKHGVTWNEWEPQRGVLTIPSVFTQARDKGYKTAIFAGKEKFRHLNATGKVDHFEIPAYEAKTVAAAAARYIEQEKPGMCFIHFADSDGAGHKFGWGTPEQKQAFADEDAALGVVLNSIRRAGIAGSSVVILSADHGGIGKTHGGPSPEEMTIPWIAWGAGVKKNFHITQPITTFDTAATALWILNIPIPANWDGKPVKSAFNFQ